MVLTLLLVAHQILLEFIQKLIEPSTVTHCFLQVSHKFIQEYNVFDFEYHKMIIWIEVAGVELCQIPVENLKVKHLFVICDPLDNYKIFSVTVTS